MFIVSWDKFSRDDLFDCLGQESAKEFIRLFQQEHGELTRHHGFYTFKEEHYKELLMECIMERQNAKV